jgi:hypothetical protein
MTGPVGSRGMVELRIAPAAPAEAADCSREDDHRAEAIGPLACGGGGGDEGGDHEDHADGLQSDDHYDDQERGQGDLNPVDGESERLSEGGVERHEFEFLEAEGDCHQDCHANDGHQLDIVNPQGGRLSEEEFVQTALVATGQFLDPREQHDPKSEEHREDQSDGRIFLHAAAADDAQDD